MSKIYPLTIADSELIDEWDHKKNTLLPENISVRSKKKAWWLCKKDHSWLAEIRRKTKCPYCEYRLPCDDNCLTSTHPELVSEWHQTKNFQLTPNNFTFRSGQKVWWKCKKKLIHEWEEKINIRSKGEGCPECLGKRYSVSNSLANIKPMIAKEFHPNKNGILTAKDFAWGSSKKVWWLCEANKKHEWEATITNRTLRLSKCPYCAKRKADENSCLAKTHPDLAIEWHPIKNGTFTPLDITAGSNREVWWLCKKNETHEWKDMISHRKAGAKCEKCYWENNSLKATHPELAAEWHPTKNAHLTPNDVTHGSSKKVWWQCLIGHGWESAISERTRRDSNTKCNVCYSHSSAGEIRVASELKLIFPLLEQRKKFAKKEADIYIEQLKLVIEFDGSYFHKNKHVKDQDKNIFFKKNGLNVIRLRGSKLEHISKNDITIDCGNIKIDSIKNLLAKIKSLYGTALNPDQKVKIEEYFKIVKFWNNEDYNESFKLLPGTVNGTNFGYKYLTLNNIGWHPKNKYLPQDYSIKSGKVILWYCKKDETHDWKARIASISNGGGCPYCSNKKTDKNNCLSFTHPELAAEWHSSKNGILTPEHVVAGSNKIVWWQCPIIASHSYMAAVDTRNRMGTACPYCSNKKTDKNNCLLFTHPKLAAEWHPTKNDLLTPENVVAGSHKKIWWLCKKDKTHDWLAHVASRAKNGNGCPFCSNKIIHKSNCLTTTHFELAAEWHPTKNHPLTSDEFTYGSKKKVWWQCPTNMSHTYCSTILSRSSGHGCPECANKVRSIKAYKRWERIKKTLE